MFVLEDAEHARRRGATVLAELAGYASTCDAYHRVQIAPDVLEPVRAIELALADASLTTDDIDYINLHGTSTELNDRMETPAIRKSFGTRADADSDEFHQIDDRPSARGLRRRRPCRHDSRHEPGNPASDDQSRPRPIPSAIWITFPGKPAPPTCDAALCNCIAFGSKNSAIVVKKTCTPL